MTTTVAPWYAIAYPDGLNVVTDREDDLSVPWLEVAGPLDDDGDDVAGVWMCDQLATFLRGDGPRPAWLDDMDRTGEGTMIGADGSKILARGPMNERGKPCNKPASRDARARLVDRIHLGK